MKREDEYDCRLRRIFLIIVGLQSAVMVFIGWKYLLGFLIGSAVSFLVYLNTVHYVDETLRLGFPAGGMHRFLNYLMWISVLVVCALLPDDLNILTCALGLFEIRFSILINEFLRKRR